MVSTRCPTTSRTCQCPAAVGIYVGANTTCAQAACGPNCYSASVNIPILDGGQIFILSIEGVIRRDLSLRFKEVITQVGFVMILLLMVVVLYFDVTKGFK